MELCYEPGSGGTAMEEGGKRWRRGTEGEEREDITAVFVHTSRPYPRGTQAKRTQTRRETPYTLKRRGQKRWQRGRGTAMEKGERWKRGWLRDGTGCLCTRAVRKPGRPLYNARRRCPLLRARTLANPEGGVASDGLFYAGETPTPSVLPLPPQRGGTAREDGEGSGGEGERWNCDGSDGEGGTEGEEGTSMGTMRIMRMMGNFDGIKSFLLESGRKKKGKETKKEREGNKESINIHKPFKI